MWEYKFVYVKDDEYSKTVELLNKAGQERWEFTGYTQDSGYGNHFLMKRRIAGVSGE